MDTHVLRASFATLSFHLSVCPSVSPSMSHAFLLPTYTSSDCPSLLVPLWPSFSPLLLSLYSSLIYFTFNFLGATKHLYNWLCPSVGWLVGRVTHSFDDPRVASNWIIWPCSHYYPPFLLNLVDALKCLSVCLIKPIVVSWYTLIILQNRSKLHKKKKSWKISEILKKSFPLEEMNFSRKANERPAGLQATVECDTSPHPWYNNNVSFSSPQTHDHD